MNQSEISDSPKSKQLVNKYYTTSSRVGCGTSSKLKDFELYRKVNGCPFFNTYEDASVSEIENAVLPFFRYYHLKRMSGIPFQFTIMLDAFNKRVYDLYQGKGAAFYSRCTKCFLNFYSLFHPAKKYRVIVPYYPYNINDIYGCSECILDTPHGIRLYSYNFSEDGIDSDDLDERGFRLQLAARAYHVDTGIKPTSMGVVYPFNKDVIYYNYKRSEKLEEFKGKELHRVRKYGSYCSACTERHCSPLIDSEDKYGWPVQFRKK